MERKIKSSNIIDGSSQTSSRNPYVDDESSDSENSENSEHEWRIKNPFSYYSTSSNGEESFENT